MITMNGKDLTLSASKIKKYQSCPEKFRLRYLDDEAEATKEERGYKDLGTAVHDSIELVLKKYPDAVDRSMLEHLLKEEYRKMDPEITSRQEDTAVECLEAAAKYLSQQKDIDIVSIEDRIEFVMNRDGLNYPSVSYCDVIVERGDGSREIWDWKTGRIREDETPEEEIQQGIMYVIAHTARYGSPPEKMKFIYLKEGKVRSRSPEEADYDDFIEDAKDLVRGLNTNNFPADPEESKCYWCDYEYFCSESKVGYANIDWEMY